MKVNHWRKPFVALLCYLGLAGWLLFTNPQEMPIIFLMVPFVLMFVALWLTTSLLLQRFFPKLARSRRIAITSCVSGVPVFLLILGSVNQLTWRDVILVAILVGFLYFYSGRIHFSES